MPKRTLSLWSLILLAGGGGGPRPRAPPGTSPTIPFGFVLAEDSIPLPSEEMVPENVELTGFVDGDVGMKTEMMDAVAVPASLAVEGQPEAFEEEEPLGSDVDFGDEAAAAAAAQAVAAIGNVGEADALFVGGMVGGDDPAVAVAFDPIVATEETEMCEDDTGRTYDIGEDIHGRPIDLYCMDYDKMEGIIETCTETGKIEKEDYERDCPPHAPLCVQIGDEGDGVAECLSKEDALQRGYLDLDPDLNSDVSSDSDDNVTTVTNMTTIEKEKKPKKEIKEDVIDVIEDDDKECVVGALRYANEESVGYKGIWCHMDDPDGRKFEGEESVCIDGEIEELENDYMSCPEGTHCVQCGWEARCVSDLTTADLQNCTGVNLVPMEPVVKCEDGGILYNVDDVIGQKTVDSCVDGKTYLGTESVCGADGIMFERSGQFQCGHETPYCVQCEGDDDARCLSEEPDCDGDSGEGDGEGDSNDSEESNPADELEDLLISGGDVFDSIPRTTNGATAASTSSAAASVRLDSSTRLLSWVFALLVPPLLCLSH